MIRRGILGEYQLIISAEIVECAFDGKADYIVTGDPDLLELSEFRGIKIVTAKKFLEE